MPPKAAATANASSELLLDGTCRVSVVVSHQNSFAVHSRLRKDMLRLLKTIVRRWGAFENISPTCIHLPPCQDLLDKLEKTTSSFSALDKRSRATPSLVANDHTALPCLLANIDYCRSKLFGCAQGPSSSASCEIRPLAVALQTGGHRCSYSRSSVALAPRHNNLASTTQRLACQGPASAAASKQCASFAAHTYLVATAVSKKREILLARSGLTRGFAWW